MGDLSANRENICAGCPGTLWGQHAVCRVHACHIGHITSCYEWDHHAELEQQRSINMAAYLLQRMEADIKSYAWNQQQVMKLVEQLDRMSGVSGCGPSSSLVAKYGVEATLPPSTAPDQDDDERYVRTMNRWKQLKESIERVDRAAAVITDEKERTVLECLLDGMKMQEIAQEVGVSRRWVHEMQNRIIRKMAVGES